MCRYDLNSNIGCLDSNIGCLDSKMHAYEKPFHQAGWGFAAREGFVITATGIKQVALIARREKHLGLGVDMLCGVTSSKLKHTCAPRRIDIGPQLVDSQVLLVDMKACQSTCNSRTPSAFSSRRMASVWVMTLSKVDKLVFSLIPTELFQLKKKVT